MTTLSEKIIKSHVGLLELTKQLGNLFKVYDIMGYSLDSFYRFKELYDEGGEAILIRCLPEKSDFQNRGPENLLSKPCCSLPLINQHFINIVSPMNDNNRILSFLATVFALFG